MSVFVDTSALLPILNRDDDDFAAAQRIWQHLARERASLLTTSYVLVESTALIQSRLGMDAVRTFQEAFRPLLGVVWVDEVLHQQGVSALLAADRRRLSLVDCVNFVVCRRRHIESVFAFDRHFAEQGFSLLTT